MLTSALTVLGLFSLDGPALIGVLVVTGLSTAPALPVMTLVLMETPGVGRRHIGAAAGIFFTVAQVGGGHRPPVSRSVARPDRYSCLGAGDAGYSVGRGLYGRLFYCGGAPRAVKS